MKDNENKKELSKNKKITLTVISVITVVLLICVTVIAVLVPKLIDGVRDDVIAKVTEEQKTLSEDITSSALGGFNFNLNSGTSISSAISTSRITIAAQSYGQASNYYYLSFADNATATWVCNKLKSSYALNTQYYALQYAWSYRCGQSELLSEKAGRSQETK